MLEATTKKWKASVLERRIEQSIKNGEKEMMF